jgi:two-component system, NtrC family, response regulator PilR
MTQSLALIVDDEADIRELVEITLSRMGVKTDAAATVAEAKDKLRTREFQLCITDMRLPDGDGIQLVEHIQRHHPTVPVAVITAYGSARAAVNSLKAGAFDFVSKPVNLDVLRKLVEAALKLRSGPDATENGGLLGESDSMRQLRGMVERLARSQAPLHICGESGTGKELVARLVHARGPRAAGPFAPVNCGAIPGELMESELFGHVKGSFTGALRDKPGLFQWAEGGTLFLDEVADLPLHMQVKLLRAVQERSVRPVGADTEVPVNVRVISATHKNLSDLVRSGLFRQDLYYRLNVIEVRVPSLRERREDIPMLAGHILARLARDNGLPAPPLLDKAALQLLQAYAFPGNVRELENILERAVTLCDGERITAADLQLTAGDLAAPGDMQARNAAAPLPRHLEDMERRAIVEALEKTRWNKTRAAEQLGMSFRALRYKIKKLGIE